MTWSDNAAENSLERVENGCMETSWEAIIVVQKRADGVSGWDVEMKRSEWI